MAEEYWLPEPICLATLRSWKDYSFYNSVDSVTWSYRMKIDGKQLTFPDSIPVKYSAKLIKEVDGEITIEAENEDSYLKVFTPFRGVAKLYVFENERWVDAETSQPFSGFDLSALGLDQLGDPGKDEETEPPKIIT